MFEVLRLCLDPHTISRVRDYEEYRLKELYDIILQDEGHPRTCFDKKYVIEPAGYDLSQFRGNDQSSVKLHAKNKKFLMGRPSFSSALPSGIPGKLGIFDPQMLKRKGLPGMN